jgi:hypothetical protein
MISGGLTLYFLGKVFLNDKRLPKILFSWVKYVLNMKLTRSLIVSAVLLGIVLVSSSWGFLVHKTTHQLAVYQLPVPLQSFFYTHIDNVVSNSVRPDQRRNSDPTEATKHFIDLEMFGTDAANKMPLEWDNAVAMFTKDSLIKYGYVPYHIIYMQAKLTEAFKQKNKDSILFYAADLGHYIGDAHVPLHTTINYDGQLTGQKGMHSLWESTVPDIEIAQYNLYTSHKASYLSDSKTAIWTAVRKGYNMVGFMLETERTVSKNFTEADKYELKMWYGKETKAYTLPFAKAYGIALKNTVNERLIESANLIADFWYTAWVDAGKPDLSAFENTSLAQDLQKELGAYQQNSLVKDGFLRALKR